MQRHLPKIVLAIAIFSVIYLFPESSKALTQIKSSVNISQNSTSTDSSIKQSTRIEISANDEETTVVDPTPIQQPTSSKTNFSSSSITPTTSVQRVQFAAPSNILTPTKIPVSPTLKPSATPTNSPAQTIDKKEYIMKAINDYRKSKGLSSVQTSTETCDFAKIRAKEISVNFNHDGFRNRINNKTLPYKKWSLVTENLAMTTNYKNVVNMWIASSGHAANMRKDTPYVCVENYGNYYAYEGMRP